MEGCGICVRWSPMFHHSGKTGIKKAGDLQIVEIDCVWDFIILDNDF